MDSGKFVINIGRELGSGGRIIGERLAKELGISFYDKELINIASQKSGLDKEFFERADEKTRFNLLGDFLGWVSNPGVESYQDNYLRNETLFKIQSDVIRSLANENSCVFVGRCADYILRDHPGAVNVFVCAELKDRINRMAGYEKVSPDKAREIIGRTDKQRADYYAYYTGKSWGMASSYHLCINTSLLGLEESIAFIRLFLKKKLDV